MSKLYPSIILLLLLSKNLIAVVAYPYPVLIKQKDGSEITIINRGDEFFHWVETSDGYTLLKNKEGIYEYAKFDQNKDLVLSGIKAKNIDKRNSIEKRFLNGTNKGLIFSFAQRSIAMQLKSIHLTEQKKAFPTTGSRQLICILIGFSDLAFTKSQTDFDNLFNQVNYNTDGASGSVRDYYTENSYGQLTLSTTVAGPYTASNTMAYYGANTGGSGSDIRPQELVSEAVALANPDVNYADYDNDNDGYVDGVYIIYAGFGEEYSGVSENAIWAHASGITPVSLDGKTISRYSCSAELRGNSGTGITRIGVISHEFGHVLGAPDFYDTNYSTGGSYTGTGQWDMMANGSWNNGGASPAHHNGFTKWYYYNWLTAIELSSPQDVIMNNIENNQVAYYINTPTSNEYWFLENRQLTGFDLYLPGHGLIIYHVDQNGISSTVNNNTINATHPQYMYPVCASASSDPTSTPSSYGTINGGGCPFPGISSNTSFTDASTPSSYDWGSNPTNKPITNIVETSGVITFDFMGGATGAPTAFSATAISSNQIDLSWSLNTNSDPILIAWSSNSTFGSPVDGVAYLAGNTIPGGGTVIYYGSSTTYSHTGLTSDTEYYYSAWSNVSGTYSDPLSDSATTPCTSVSTFPWNEDFSGLDLPQCWSIDDHEGNGQIWTFTNSVPIYETSVNTTTAGNGFAILDSDGYGSNNSQDCDIITPTFDLTSYTDVFLEFEHFLRVDISETGTLSYSTDNGTSWSAIQSWNSSTANAVTFSQDLTVQVAGESQVKFKWNYSGSFGYYWIIDDISLTANLAVQSNTTISNTAYGSGDTDCFDAQQTITVAGDGYNVNLTSGSSVTMIAGQNILLKPGFHAQSGSYLSAYITTNQSFCSQPAPIVFSQTNFATKETLSITSILDTYTNKPEFVVYPNPNMGSFTVEHRNFDKNAELLIYTTTGKLIHRTRTSESITNIVLSQLNRGTYIVQVKDNTQIKYQKLIVN